MSEINYTDQQQQKRCTSSSIRYFGHVISCSYHCPLTIGCTVLTMCRNYILQKVVTFTTIVTKSLRPLKSWQSPRTCFLSSALSRIWALVATRTNCDKLFISLLSLCKLAVGLTLLARDQHLVNIWSTSGQPLVNLWSLSGRSLVGLWLVSCRPLVGLRLISLRSFCSCCLVFTEFIKQKSENFDVKNLFWCYLADRINDYIFGRGHYLEEHR